jgi:hypothetical protein
MKNEELRMENLPLYHLSFHLLFYYLRFTDEAVLKAHLNAKNAKKP